MRRDFVRLLAMEYGLTEKIVTPIGKPELATAMASGAIYGAAEAWTHTAATSQRMLDAHVTKVITALAGIVVPNPHAPLLSQRKLTFE